MTKTFGTLALSSLIFTMGCISSTKSGTERRPAGESCQKTVARIATPLLSIARSPKDKTFSSLRIAGGGISIPIYPRSHMEPYDNNPHRGYYLVVDIENTRTHERNRVAAPPNWRRKHIERHNRIWSLSRQAIAGKNVEANVTEIMKYLDEDSDADDKSVLVELGENLTYVKNASGGGFYDVVDQALGEIRSPLAARKLMSGITRDINKAKQVPSEKRVKHHFWAPEALGSLDYSKDEPLRVEVETFLINLTDQYYSKDSVLSYNGLEALAQPAFNTPRVREYIANHKLARDWDMWRVYLTWNDPAMVPDILKRLHDSTMEEHLFSHGLSLLLYFKDRFKEANVTDEQVFQSAVEAWESRPSQWMNDFGARALASLAPIQCLPGGI